MSEELVVRRRPRKPHPLRARRVGAAFAAPAGVGPAEPFPGLTIPEPAGAAHRFTAGGLAFLLHGIVIGTLFLLAALAPEVEQIIEDIEFVRAPEARKDPAPAPRAIAESFAAFDPAPQSIEPQIVNPTVTARAVPSVSAEQIEVADVAPVRAPQVVARANVAVETVSAFQSVAVAPTTPIKIDAGAPAIRGPIEMAAPVGPSVGPRAIAAPGDTIGTGPVTALGTGSSVRDGVSSDRDVHGTADGPRVANVQTRVGDSFMRGTGGSGTGPGGVSFEDCMKRPEVQRYWATIRERMLERWVIPPNVPPNQSSVLEFRLDASGSATSVKLVQAEDSLLGRSAVDALRAASPFPPMPDPVRCLAGDVIIGTFRNPEVASGRLAN